MRILPDGAALSDESSAMIERVCSRRPRHRLAKQGMEFEPLLPDERNRPLKWTCNALALWARFLYGLGTGRHISDLEALTRCRRIVRDCHEDLASQRR